MSSTITELSKSQTARNELMEWFESANDEEQKICIVTYAGMLQEMISIYNQKTKENGKCEFAELGQGQ